MQLVSSLKQHLRSVPDFISPKCEFSFPSWVTFNIHQVLPGPCSVHVCLCVCFNKQTPPRKTPPKIQPHSPLDGGDCRFGSEGKDENPFWRWWHCHSQGRWLSGEAEYWSLHRCSAINVFVFLSLWFLGGAGAAASSGQPHPGILWECKDSEKWQLLPLCEYLLSLQSL